ncbi:MAG TPA: hypothetical protein VMW11_10090 [Candidatus Dormibacteraeota bacterium]|nr:hypothetical protein [Candidatus Dormibacteraeota bacterium]
MHRQAWQLEGVSTARREALVDSMRCDVGAGEMAGGADDTAEFGAARVLVAILVAGAAGLMGALPVVGAQGAARLQVEQLAVGLGCLGAVAVWRGGRLRHPAWRSADGKGTWPD